MRKIISIGFPIHPDLNVETVDHHERISLDDPSVILFRMPSHPWTTEKYRGKPTLDEGDTDRYFEQLAHWKRELRNACDAGKTLFIEASEPDSFYYDTGKKEFSGTGRNRHTTRLVDKASSNNLVLPFDIPTFIVGRGTTMRLSKDGHILSSYWRKFSQYSRYEVRFETSDEWQTLLETSGAGNAAAICSLNLAGQVFFLPRISVFADYYWTYDEDDEGDDQEDDEGADNENDDRVDESLHRKLSAWLIEELLSIDSQVRKATEKTPAPDWLIEERWQTDTLRELSAANEKLQLERAAIEHSIEETTREVQKASRVQDLLYEKGLALECATLHALSIFGITAVRFQDATSEFDAVFSIDGVRMLGEVEGRDHSPINIDKISQLERNVNEDFAKDDVIEHAKGVLFGNPQRLIQPDERTETFTKKCFQSAMRNKFALVLTSLLFEPVRYLESHPDNAYASICRKAILNTEGAIVDFPPPPDQLGAVEEDMTLASAKSARRRTRKTTR